MLDAAGWTAAARRAHPTDRRRRRPCASALPASCEMPFAASRTELPPSATHRWTPRRHPPPAGDVCDGRAPYLRTAPRATPAAVRPGHRADGPLPEPRHLHRRSSPTPDDARSNYGMAGPRSTCCRDDARVRCHPSGGDISSGRRALRPHPSRSRTMHASRRTIRRAGILLTAALSSSALIAPGSPPAQASEAAAPHPRRTGRTPNGPCCRRPRACAPRSKATREAVTPASSWATTTSPCGGRGRFRRPSRRRWRMRLVGWRCGYGAQRTRRPSCGPPPAGSARGWMPIPAAGSTA